MVSLFTEMNSFLTAHEADEQKQFSILVTAQHIKNSPARIFYRVLAGLFV